MKAPLTKRIAQPKARADEAAAVVCMPALGKRVLQALLAVVLAFSLSMTPIAFGNAEQSNVAYASEAKAISEEGQSGDEGGDSPQQPDPDPVRVKVPGLNNLTLTDAKNALSAKGLTWVIEGDTSQTATVIGQNPSYGTVVAQGSTVTLYTQAPQAAQVSQVFVGYEDPDTKEKIQYPSEAAGQIPLVKVKGGKLQLYASVKWDNGGNGGWASNEGVPVEWSSDDPSIATVDPTGVLTAQGDGTVTIRCSTLQYGTAQGNIKVRVAGQDGPYVVQVAVTRADGSPYGDERVVLDEYDGTTAIEFFAKVLYSDGTTKSTAAGDTIDNLEWSVSDKDTGSINKDTGLFRPSQDGNVAIIASVSGGLDGVVEGYTYVVIDTGQFREGYMPSDTLTIHVVYASDESREYVTKTYDVASFSSLGLSYARYTQVTNHGSYQTLVAQGVYLSTVLASVGVTNVQEVSHLRFKALDGIGNAMVTGDYLFNRAGYYFPQFDQGLLGGAEAAAPMVAILSKSRTNSVDGTYSDLGEGTRFRLCVGSSSKTDPAASRSYMYCSDMYVVLKGAPPTDLGNGSGTQGSDNGIGGIGGGDFQAGENDAQDVVDTNGTTPEGTAATETVMAVTDTVDLPSQAADRKVVSDAEQAAGEPSSGASQEAEDADSNRRWQVFEMMSNAEADIEPIDFYNPLEPFFIPAVLLVMIAGGFYANTRFRRELFA